MAELIQELKKEKDHLEKVIQAVEKGWQKFRLPFSQSFDMEKALPLELQRKQVAQMLGCSVDTFDIRFRNAPGFPVCKNGKYPRDAVREWYNQHWQEI